MCIFQLESFAMDISFGHQQLWVADKEGNLQLYDASLGQFEHIKASTFISQEKILRTLSKLSVLYIDNLFLIKIIAWSVIIMSSINMSFA